MVGSWGLSNFVLTPNLTNSMKDSTIENNNKKKIKKIWMREGD